MYTQYPFEENHGDEKESLRTAPKIKKCQGLKFLSMCLIVHFCPNIAGRLPRDVNTEMVTKVVPMRAVELSIGAFCTECRCEQLRDADIFRDWGRIFDFPRGSTACQVQRRGSRRFALKKTGWRIGRIGNLPGEPVEINSNWNSNSLTPRNTMRGRCCRHHPSSANLSW